MTESINRHQLSRHTNDYLEANDHSEAAVSRVVDVLSRFDFMVSLATQRALEALQLPGADPMAPIAKVLPFQREYAYPGNDSLPPAC